MCAGIFKRQKPFKNLVTSQLRQRLTLFGHSHSEALLQATVLAAVPRHFVDDAVLVPVTRVHHVLLNASTEKALRKHTKGNGEVSKEFHVKEPL